ncbi:hypothetical protein [Psychrobacter ciconiae]|uniref:hypothetical protein n=1 Tax=Psychrobacter ciconiae TaxID=1553449 RepID=UPI0019194514|nr:hypothetical protein [Psychrobacter ciconiae]
MSTQSNTANHTNNTGDDSNVKKAAENVNPEQLQENLQQDKSVDAPEKLTDGEETPFIDDSLRTDN